MARIIPEATDAELSTWPSAAERRVYRTCSSLPADWLVIHGLRTTAPGPRGALRDGEADFTIFDPDRGLLCIEVKGGAIEYDGRTRKWWGHRRGGQRVWRTDPFNQAMKRKNDLVRAVMGSAAWKEAKAGALPKAHAVLFPDIDDLTPITLPDAPPEIVGGRRHMKDLEGWIDEVWRAWEPRVQRPKPLPDNAMELVESTPSARPSTTGPTCSGRPCACGPSGAVWPSRVALAQGRPCSLSVEPNSWPTRERRSPCSASTGPWRTSFAWRTSATPEPGAATATVSTP